VARFDSHELFHVYAFRASGVTTSIGLLEEGLATAFACSPVRSNGDYHPGDWRNFVNVAEKLADLSDPDIADQYAAAGAFVAFLYYTFGWDKLALLYRSLRRGDDATALEGAVLSVYGADMDTLWQDSRTFPNKRICITDWTCWSSPVVLNEETRQECDGELHRSIELSEPSSVALFATHPVMLWQDCLAEPGPIFVLGQNSFPSVTWVSLAAGSFNLTRTSGSESINPRVYPASFSLELTSQIPGSFLASSCEAAQAIPLDPQVETRILFPSTASLSGWVRVDGPAAAVFSVVSDQLQTDIPNYPGGALHGDTSFCDSCSTDANCQAISSQVSLAFSGGGVLRLTNVYAVSFPEMGFPNAGFHISPM
jgi:hypothetical protein